MVLPSWVAVERKMGFCLTGVVRQGDRRHAGCSFWFYDLPKRQVDSFVDREFGFGDRMLPVLLHRSRHDDERSVACEECLRFSREVVPNTEFSRCP